MKKIITLILALCMVLSAALTLASCKDKNGGENTNANGNSSLTKEQWQSTISLSSFDNVTFSVSGNFISGFESEEKAFSYTYKIDGEAATDGENYLTGEIFSSLKSVYLGTASAMLENYNDFTYDAAADVYKSNKDIVYNVTVSGIDAQITAKNVSVKLDTNSKLASVSCEMTQSFNEGGTDKEYVLNVTFTYSDYGTTVISDNTANSGNNGNGNNGSGNNDSGKTDIDNSELSSSQWLAEFSFNYTDYYWEVVTVKNEKIASSFNATVSENVIKMVESDIASQKTAIDYASKEGDSYFLYDDNTEAFDFNATRTYTKMDYNEEDFYNNQNALKYACLSQFVPMYDSFSCDAVTNTYSAEAIIHMTVIKIVILEGQISYITYTVGDTLYNISIRYNQEPIVLPNVQQN